MAPRNATALVRQYLRLNGHPAAGAADATGAACRRPTPSIASRCPAAAPQIVREWRRDGRLVARHVEVAGLGHAWSGGDATLAYNDAGPPDATALVGDFFADALS